MSIVAHTASLSIATIGSPFLPTLACITLTSTPPGPFSMNTDFDPQHSLPAFTLLIGCRSRNAVPVFDVARNESCDLRWVLFHPSCCDKRRNGSDIPFFAQLSCRYGRLSTPPAPWRRGALLLPLRGPPRFRFLPKRPALPRRLFRVLRKMQSLSLGAGATCLRVPRKRAGQKKEIQIMYQNRVSLIGFVGNDAQLKTTKSGTPVAVFIARHKILLEELERSSTSPALSGIAARLGASSPSSPASWRKERTCRSKASFVTASTKSTAGVMRTTLPSRAVWPKFTLIES